MIGHTHVSFLGGFFTGENDMGGATVGKEERKGSLHRPECARRDLGETLSQWMGVKKER